jgi:hypothetical protein
LSGNSLKSSSKVGILFSSVIISNFYTVPKA